MDSGIIKWCSGVKREQRKPLGRRVGVRGARCVMALQVMALLLMALPSASGNAPDIALDFDGSSHVQTQVSAGDLGIAGAAPKTVEAWVYARAFNYHGGVFALGNRGSNGADFSLITLGSPDRWRVVFWAMDLDFSHPSENQWMHVAVVYDGKEAIVYADGKERARRECELDTNADEAFRIGRWWDNDGGAFDGRIAEVRIWNRALDQEEIKTVMSGALSGDEPGLVAYWPLNDAAGDSARETVSGQASRFVGSPQWRLAQPFSRDIDQRTIDATTVESLTLGPVELLNPEGEVTYQWYLDNRPIEGATGKTLEIPRIREQNLGTYHVRVDDARELTPVNSGRVRLAVADWPMWRFDPARSAATPMVLSEDLHLQWRRQLPASRRAWPFQHDDAGKLDFDVSYSPVVMGNRIFVPSNVTDSLTAYDIANGDKLWRFYADGPIRLAPAAWRDRVFAVSDDGHLYCLRAADGELLWKFRGGPSDHRLLGNERIINFWAARGGPVVEGGIVYFAAGFWPLHGVFIHALDAESGEQVWVNDITSSEYVGLPHGGAYGFGGLAPQGYIAVDNDRLIVSGGRGPPAYFSLNNGEILRLNPRDGHKGGGGYAVHAGGMGMQRNSMLQNRVRSLSSQIEGEVFYKLAAHDRLFVTTMDGQLYCFGPEQVEPRQHAYNPAPLEPRSNSFARVAGALEREVDTSGGYALALGAGSGDLVRELLVRSNLHVVVVEQDEAKVQALRDELVASGMYGSRAAVIEADPATFSVQPYLFSAIVSEDAAAAGIRPDARQLAFHLERLKPYGGFAWFGFPQEQSDAYSGAAREVEVDRVTLAVRGTQLLARREGPLTGAGSWTHQHYNAGNTLVSPEQRARLPLGVLWFGGPSHDNILPRHSGGPKPQIAGGRQVFLGVETISARCVYTGRELWVREFPGIGHPFTNLELEERWASGRGVYMDNIPGATYISSPLVTLPDSVYLRYGGRIYRIAPDTGEILARLHLPGRSAEQIYGEGTPDWGHVSVHGDVLVTTAEPHMFEDQRLGWTHSYSGTSSRKLVALDRHTGRVLWQRDARVGFRHNAITSGKNTVFVADGLSSQVLEFLARRGEEPGQEATLMALDLRTGAERWQTSERVFGMFLAYSEEHDILLEGGSHDLRHRLRDEPSRIAARRGQTGEIIWRGGNFVMPAAISGEMLIPGRPGQALSLLTGDRWTFEQQHTGREEPWNYHRRYGCNTLVASKNMLLFRSGYAGFFDLEHETGTGSLGGFRSGCTANLLPAEGLVNALDYTRTCTCSYGIQTSLALVHMPDDPNIEFWTVQTSAPPNPAEHGINFGAPGNRIDNATGRVWFSRDGQRRRHPSAIVDNGGGINWVASSGREGSGEIRIEDILRARYRVRLHFAELDKETEPGERRFDVLINGQTVLRDYDIVERAGGPLRGVVETAVVDADDRLIIELRKNDASRLEPLINGIELFVEASDLAGTQ